MVIKTDRMGRAMSRSHSMFTETSTQTEVQSQSVVAAKSDPGAEVVKGRDVQEFLKAEYGISHAGTHSMVYPAGYDLIPASYRAAWLPGIEVSVI